MKVVCIDDRRGDFSDTGTPIAHCYFPNGWIVAGEIYTVVAHDRDRRGFILYEKPIVHPLSKVTGWGEKRFVPLEYFQAEFQVAEGKEQQDVVLR